MTIRVGPCSPWINGDAVRGSERVKRALEKVKGDPPDPDRVLALCGDAAEAATEVLYNMSGRQFTGSGCVAKIRPVARPADVDVRNWLGNAMTWGYSASWGSCSYYGLGVGGIATHFGCSAPPEIEFGVYPVNTIEEVWIDGQLIPADEYELRDHRTLVRLRTSASEVPSVRWGWPTCQIEDLPLTELGTFGVTFTYGQDPGAGGRMAAATLAELFVLPKFGDHSQTPQRLTSISRQGVSMQVADVIDLLEKGSLGVWEVDAWLLSVNPGKQRRQSRVWSPDLGRNRRVPNSTSGGTS